VFELSNTKRFGPKPPFRPGKNPIETLEAELKELEEISEGNLTLDNIRRMAFLRERIRGHRVEEDNESNNVEDAQVLERAEGGHYFIDKNGNEIDCDEEGNEIEISKNYEITVEMVKPSEIERREKSAGTAYELETERRAKEISQEKKLERTDVICPKCGSNNSVTDSEREMQGRGYTLDHRLIEHLEYAEHGICTASNCSGKFTNSKLILRSEYKPPTTATPRINRNISALRKKYLSAIPVEMRNKLNPPYTFGKRVVFHVPKDGGVSAKEKSENASPHLANDWFENLKFLLDDIYKAMVNNKKNISARMQVLFSAFLHKTISLGQCESLWTYNHRMGVNENMFRDMVKRWPQGTITCNAFVKKMGEHQVNDGTIESAINLMKNRLVCVNLDDDDYDSLITESKRLFAVLSQYRYVNGLSLGDRIDSVSWYIEEHISINKERMKAIGFFESLIVNQASINLFGVNDASIIGRNYLFPDLQNKLPWWKKVLHPEAISIIDSWHLFIEYVRKEGVNC